MTPETRETWIIHQARERPNAERPAFLDGACAGDVALRERLEALLAVHDQTETLLATQAESARPTIKLDLADAPDEAVGQTLGRYKLLERVGEGGCGVVYVAEQTEPVRRRVALKVIKLGMDTKQVVARFEAERQALAMMDHPNIAKVLDAGTTDVGRPFFVMELVRGIKITDYCDQANLTTKERLDLFIKVCQAIQHAHQKGIIHRYIKPSNILVMLNDGVPVPKVIDFGIAKATEGRLTDNTVYTQLHQFIGTPAYMSPEQAEMSGLDIDTRSDIYSLGVLLYELLAGSTPFDPKELMSQGIDAMRRTIREKEPARPSARLATLQGEELTTTARRRAAEAPKLLNQLRGDLDWIVMKCLEKDRTRRYETANGLAADLKRHLNNEPVGARPPSTGYRFQKLVRRNKLVFAAAGMVVAALLLGIVVSTWQAIRATEAEREQSRLRASEAEQRRSAETARQKEAMLRQQAQAQELVARRAAYNAGMNLAQQALQLNNIGRALEILNRHRPKPGENDLRGWEWRYLWRFCQSDALFTLCRQSNDVVSVSFSPDGKFLAVEDRNSEVAIWDLGSHQRVLSRKTQVFWQRIAFSPVGNQLAFCEKGSDGQRTVKLWDADKGQEVMQWSIPGEGRELVFSRNGSTLAAWGATYPEKEAHIFLWDITSGRKLFETAAARGAGDQGNLLALSDRAETFAYGSPGGEIVVIEVASGREKRRLKVTDDFTMAVAILDGGKVLASAAGYGDPLVKLWDMETGKEVALLDGHRSYVSALACSLDGRLLASASGDQTIRIWDWKERRCLMTLRGHLSEVLDIAFAPDSKTLASGCKDGTVLIWNIASTRNERTYDFLPDVRGSRGGWSFAPDSRMVIDLDDESGAVRSWATTDLQQNRRFEALGTNNASFAFSKSGVLLAVGTRTGRIRVINWLTGVETGNFTSGSGSVQVLGFAEDNLLLTHDEQRVVSLWDIRSGERKHHWQITEQWRRQLARAADVLATTQDEGQLTLWRTEDGRRLWTAKTQDESYTPVFSNHGEVIAVPSGRGPAMLFETRNGAHLGTLGGFLLGTHSAAFSPDDERLAVGSDGKEAVKVWDTELRQEVLTLEGQGSQFSRTAFSSDGHFLGSSGTKGLHLWRAPSWEEIAAAEAKEKAEGKQP